MSRVRRRVTFERLDVSTFDGFMQELTRQAFIWRMARNNKRPTPVAARLVAHRAEVAIDAAVLTRAHALEPNVPLALKLLAELRAEHAPVACTIGGITPHRHCQTCGTAYPWPCPMYVRINVRSPQ